MILESESVLTAGARNTRNSIVALRERLSHVIRGKTDALEMVLVCLLARGHLLLEDRDRKSVV